jgi:hypothetical protein
MIATIAGDVLAVLGGILAAIMGLTLWFVRIIAEFRERLTRLETKFEDHYWHDRPGKED